MYERYWQFEFNPFENDADPRALFRSETHQAALLKLRYLIEHRKGAGLLVGGAGLGKSYLLRSLCRQLDEACGPHVHVVFPRMSASELLAYLAAELGSQALALGRENSGVDRSVREIERLFAEYNEQERHPVVIIDEAHVIDDARTFEALRLLLNFQRNQRPLFSLILAGQPALLNTVRRMGQLDERIAVRCLLRALTREETGEYIQGRLQAAGARRPIFAEEALQPLYELSGGVPRRINRLCDLALLVGYADESQTISAAQVEAVAQDMTTAAAA